MPKLLLLIGCLLSFAISWAASGAVRDGIVWGPGAVKPDAVVAPKLFLATTTTHHYGQLSNNIYRFHAALTPSLDDSAVVHSVNASVSIPAFEPVVEITQQIVHRAGGQ